jgi:hypothetical protein
MIQATRSAPHIRQRPLKNGEDLKLVSEALGHANPAITLNIDQRILPGMKERVGAAIDRILGWRMLRVHLGYIAARAGSDAVHK